MVAKGAIKKRKLIPPSHTVQPAKVAQFEEQTELSELMFDPYLTSNHPFVITLADNLTFAFEHFIRNGDDVEGDGANLEANRLPVRKRRMKDADKANLHNMLMAVLSNLALSASHGTKPPSVGVIMRSSREKVTRYHRPAFTGLPKLLSDLAKAKVGLTLKTSKTKGISSAVFANAALEEVLGRFQFDAGDFQKLEGEETIRLSHKEHDYVSNEDEVELIDYADTPETIRYRAELKTINETLKAAQITLDGLPPPAASNQLSRYFSLPTGFPQDVERFDLGGRLFGGWWQNIPKVKRKTIRIDREACVELDFSSMFLRLAYLEAGLTPPKRDLYAAVQGDFSAPQWREGVKKLVNALFFASSSLEKLPRGTKELLPPNTKITAIREAILAAHPALSFLTERGLGFRLMFIESQILVAALLKLAAQGVTALPLHDGLLCAKSKASVIREAMSEASKAVTGFELVIALK